MVCLRNICTNTLQKGAKDDDDDDDDDDNNNNNKAEILKYENVITEIQRVWNVKTKVIPVITGATGAISESLGQYLSDTPGEHEIKELQKIAVLGTAHIQRVVLMSDYKTYFTAEITLLVAQIVNTEQLQHCTEQLQHCTEQLQHCTEQLQHSTEQLQHTTPKKSGLFQVYNCK
jgi:hypothetical protein